MTSEIANFQMENLKIKLAQVESHAASVMRTLDAVVARANRAEEALVRISEALRVYKEANKL